MRIIVIGGGIVGLATAMRLQERFPNSSILVLEKEKGVGTHQSGHNSGVLHCGLYYKPGSLKARLAVAGIRQMIAFCEKNSIPFEVCGKLVVASDHDEVPRLHDLFDRGVANGLKGLQLLSPQQMREIEPHVAGVAGIRVPEEGIVDYPEVCKSMARHIRERNGRVVMQARVVRLRRLSGEWIVTTDRDEYAGDYVVNCAGLHCDRISGLAGQPPTMRIIPFRGEYYKLKTAKSNLVRNLIYPVPDPRFPFLGVHFTRLIHGGIEAGPNAVLAFAREGYRKTDVSLRDMFGIFTYRGFWRFVAKYPKLCSSELRRSFSKRLFCRSLNRLVPELRPEDLEPGGAGVRAQAINHSGETLQDFSFGWGDHALHVLNAPSPGATASLAIGQEIAERMAQAI